MAPQSRRNSTDVIAALKREPHRFGFFQAIRLLALAGPKPGDPLAMPAGLRFRTRASLAFPASEITAVADRARSGPAEAQPLELEVGFLGLTGPAGVLPPHYTETLLERRHLHRDTGLHAFLDIFNHRACCLFYAAWRKYRFHIAFEQGQRNGFTGHLADLLTVRSPRNPGPGPDPAAIPQMMRIHFAGLLARRPLPAGSLVAFLGAYFRVRVRLEPFVGQWTAVPPAQQTRLDARSGLGAGAFLGERLWDQQNKVSLRLGPLTGAAFRDFLPHGPAAMELRQIIRLHFGELLACDLELDLIPEAVPLPRLSGVAPDAPRLGLDSWLRTRPMAGPPGPVAFRLQA
jgi:type VI secretion system protein ImpH